MAVFNYNDKNVYYEVNGEGKPILLLNGIMMSTASWEYFKDPLSHSNQFITLDFLDQGKSAKLEAGYSQEVQVDLIKALLEELGIEKINIVGISYGGEVALQFALKYADKLDRLILFNTTAKTNPWLRDIGRSWMLSGEDPLNYYLTTIPIIYSPKFYNENIQWMEERKELLTKYVFSDKAFMDSMDRLTVSAENYDITNRLNEIDHFTLIIGAEHDFITPLAEQKLLNKEIKNSELIILPETGHGAMYERPLLFTSLILGFINNTKLEYGIV